MYPTKIINDPIYGFIKINNPLILELIDHPYFQRLKRIKQLGLAEFVYPGAHHTRFHHALGAMHLMQKAVQVLRSKGIAISDKEQEALLIAILLHDIGHGPFSHAMEHSIVENISHEEISLLFMEELNTLFDDRLTLAITIFKNQYHRKFLHQLISSQLDMDRLDYLRRDSFYTGVSEGSINSERLIAMLHVKEDRLVVEEKGIYSVEKFIIARRLMYWQVYLHKTSLVAENLLIRLLQRAKELTLKGEQLEASKALLFFLNNSVSKSDFNNDILNTFAQLDDVDILAAIEVTPTPQLAVLSAITRDTIAGQNGNNFIEPGETIEILPLIRNYWGHTEDVRVGIEFAEFEDTSKAEILESEIAIGSISAYANLQKLDQSLKIKLADNIANNVNIQFKVSVWSGENLEYLSSTKITINVKSSVLLFGFIKEDTTLTSDKEYLISDQLVIDNCTLTIEPGTILKISNNISISFSPSARLSAIGDSDNWIHIVPEDNNWGKFVFNNQSTIEMEYVIVEGFKGDFGDPNGSPKGSITNCIFQNNSTRNAGNLISTSGLFSKNNIIENDFSYVGILVPTTRTYHNNIINNIWNIPSYSDSRIFYSCIYRL